MKKEMINRDSRVDSVRGILLVLMTLNHIGSDMRLITYEPLGFVSAAEGFILLSAYTYAITSKFGSGSLTSFSNVARKRAKKIYKCHIGLFFLMLFISLFISKYNEYWDGRLFANDGSIVKTILGGMTLVHQPLYLDTLPMYLIFSLISPIVLAGLAGEQRKWVLSISIFFWLVSEYIDPLGLFAQWINGRPSFFNVFSWQLLWVAGLYIGYIHKTKGKILFLSGKFLLSAAVLVTVTCFAMRHEFYALPTETLSYFDKADLSVLRLLNTNAQMFIFLKLVQSFERTSSLPWFSFLGRYSLQVFTFHVLLVYLLMPIGWRVEKFGIAGNLAYSVLVIASLSLPALFYRRYIEGRQTKSGPPTAKVIF